MRTIRRAVADQLWEKFPKPAHMMDEAAITRLVGSMLLEQNDEWQLQHRYMQLEGWQSLVDSQPARLSAVVN